ncbi:PEP-CTERM sorting domain-containing protein, partial [Citrifermentans bremense]|uniref:PEP-CTERM sorting domain-containing protein n=1 Tax=Citrifermentans bremense TaxID=60035 RepID=UPI000478A500
PAIDVVTMGAVTVASGYANIKQSGTDLLTSLTFTPLGEEKYGDFSFRGQLVSAGTIQVNVTDQNGVNTGLEQVKQIDFSPQAAPIPEPSTFILLAFGLAGVGLLRKRSNA